MLTSRTLSLLSASFLYSYVNQYEPNILLDSKKKIKSKIAPSFGLYLDDPSSNQISHVVKKEITLNNNNIANNFVIVHKNIKEEDDEIYRVLYGYEAAFRLKGILYDTNKNGEIENMIGIGKVSTMNGVLTSSYFDKKHPISSAYVGLPITQCKQDDVKALKQAYLKEILNNSSLYDKFMNNLWNDKIIDQFKLDELPESLSESESYSNKYHVKLDDNENTNTVTFVSLPKSKQVVVAGTLCSCIETKEDDMDFNFKSDRSRLNETSSSSSPSPSPSPSPATKGKKDGGSSDGDNDECPICKFVKGGSCRKEFLLLQEWQDKDKVYLDGEGRDEYRQVAAALYNCMSKDEYYDGFIVQIKNL